MAKADADERGRAASRPRELRGRGWMDVLRRVRREAKNDSVGLVAAGVAFYSFFALFPAIAAIVAIYGLVASPDQVDAQVAALGSLLPEGVLEIVRGQLARVSGSSTSALGWSLVASVLLALWGASKGVRGLVKAMKHRLRRGGDPRLRGADSARFASHARGHRGRGVGHRPWWPYFPRCSGASAWEWRLEWERRSPVGSSWGASWRCRWPSSIGMDRPATGRNGGGSLLDRCSRS